MRTKTTVNFKNVLITGGAGFIGSNLADFLLSCGLYVTIFDNLSRKNVEKNLFWLNDNYHNRLKVIIKDVRDKKSVYEAIKNKDVIFHLAAQVAVTDSIKSPIEDFEINALGSLNVLEGIRKLSPETPVIYSSTNKVYGKIDSLATIKKGKRYIFADKKYQEGIDENYTVDFYSPYGCSKGAADQYFRDYSRIYNLKTIVFRQSCIYGNRQFGNEDQGWVMHFLKNSVSGKNIDIYGDGKQVRDILYIDDLIEAYLLSLNNLDISSGKIYNIGGGLNNSVSLIELLLLIEKDLNIQPKYVFRDWRPGDQKIFYCNLDKIRKELRWEPKIDVNDGLDKLNNWVKQLI
ncbi:MAG TPA: GDP-mannose 4,6-dehydratase [Patescibacteria group bacterium]|nr:GDP-mannose 4,6-dehydratase [Patescibacteria group bacterium]